MNGSFFATGEQEDALRRAGIRDYDSAMGYSGGLLVTAHHGRSVVRFEGLLFLKRTIGRKGEVPRERRALARLGEGPGPEPVPVVAHGEGKRGDFLLTALPGGARPLEDALRVLTGRDRREILEAVGQKIRAVHDRGLTVRDLFARHLLVGRESRIWLLDVGRLAPRRGLPARARDLAALESSLPFGAASDADRVRILAAWLGRSPKRGEPVLEAIRRAAARLARRRRHRVDRLVAKEEDREWLASFGIRTFDDLHGYAGRGANRLRRLPDRENWRVELGGRTFYVKRHRPVRGLATTPAAREWAGIAALRRARIRTMQPFALGEDVRKGSSLWTRALPGRPLDDLLREGRFDFRARREIVREAAEIFRSFRRLSMHHRDFYLCHLIADPEAPPGRRLAVIDLQRLRKKPGLRERWFVKDAAQFLHSAPRPPITRTDLVRFLRWTFGVAKLTGREKAFAARVIRKAARIGARAGRRSGP